MSTLPWTLPAAHPLLQFLQLPLGATFSSLPFRRPRPRLPLHRRLLLLLPLPLLPLLLLPLAALAALLSQLLPPHPALSTTLLLLPLPLLLHPLSLRPRPPALGTLTAARMALEAATNKYIQGQLPTTNSEWALAASKMAGRI